MFDEIFLIPLLTGLLLALLLPLLGCYLRLREESLSALAYSHLAAAGALLGSVAGFAALPGGLLLAALAGGAKEKLARRFGHGAVFPLLLLLAWALGILLTANFPMAERLGHALFDGQLYFADPLMLLCSALWVPLVMGGMVFLSKALLLTHIYPALAMQPAHKQPYATLLFDLLVALSLALATMSLGVMGAFALIFIPPWVAFRRSPNWRAGLRLALLLGGGAYLLAFALALYFDQPFGPILAMVLIVLGGLLV